MSESLRIDALRRRVEGDPTSLTFAALAEEYRRAGRHDQAIETCRRGLRHHPGYLSARVTLGRSLIEVGRLDEAKAELEQVVRVAPENLAAVRGLIEIHRRRGDAGDARSGQLAALEEFLRAILRARAAGDARGAPRPDVPRSA